MNWRQFFTSSMVCVLAWLMLAVGAPGASAFNEPETEPPTADQAAEEDPRSEVAGFAKELVDTAVAEHAVYGGRDECSSLRTRIGEYWQDLGISWDGCTDQPWSAAFISAMMKKAGAGAEFRYSAAHREYIHDAFAGGRGLYGTAVSTSGANVYEGDLVCSGRARVSGWNYSDFERWYSTGAADAIPTHCDIVVAVNGSSITVIGGNVGNRVTRKTVSLGSYALVLSLADPLAWEAEAYEEARAQLDLWVEGHKPSFKIWPHPEAQVVRLESFLWIADEGWKAQFFTHSVNDVDVAVMATPVTSYWEFTETNTGSSLLLECDGRGDHFDPGDIAATCGHLFEHSSSVIGPVQLSVRVAFDLTVTSSLPDDESNFVDGEVVAEGAVSDALEHTLIVNEVLSYGIDEDAERPSSERRTATTIHPEVVDCNWFVDGLLTVVGVSCETAHEAWGLIKSGFAACGEGVAGSIGDTVTALKDLATTNPIDTIKEGVAGINELIKLAKEDPAAFAQVIAEGAIGITLEEWEGWDNETRIEKLIGVFCAKVFEYITGKGFEKIFDILKRGDGKGDGTKKDDDETKKDDEEEETVCPSRVTDSFRAGTLVLMGDGSHMTIEQVDPGDYVLSYDTAERQWRPQLVLDQWIAIDDGHMTTVTLADGSHIDATDHHRFWLPAHNAWMPADSLIGGDVLLTPSGPVTVASSITAEEDFTLVYELTVANDHNFTVQAGMHDLLVHNCGGDNKKSPEQRKRDREQADAQIAELDDKFKPDHDEIDTDALEALDNPKKPTNVEEPHGWNTAPKIPSDEYIVYDSPDGGLIFEKMVDDPITGEPRLVAVEYNSQGYPDFGPHAAAEVNLNDITPEQLADWGFDEDILSRDGFPGNGDRSVDFDLANRMVDKSDEWARGAPPGYNWHHVPDLDGGGGVLQLVPDEIHLGSQGGFPHAGGVSLD